MAGAIFNDFFLGKAELNVSLFFSDVFDFLCFTACKCVCVFFCFFLFALSGYLLQVLRSAVPLLVVLIATRVFKRSVSRARKVQLTQS